MRDPVPAQTGALDDHRHDGRQLAAAIAGWLLVAALIFWLADTAKRLALRVSLFLVGVTILIAALATSLAIEVLRPRLLRRRNPRARAGPRRPVDRRAGASADQPRGPAAER